jgi:hypothetical protein
MEIGSSNKQRSFRVKTFKSLIKFELLECRGVANSIPYSEPEKRFSQGVILQHKLYNKMKLGCKGLTGIHQIILLWKGGDSSDGQVKFNGMELCIKYVVLLAFENVYIMRYNKECVV